MSVTTLLFWYSQQPIAHGGETPPPDPPPDPPPGEALLTDPAVYYITDGAGAYLTGPV